MYWPRVTELIYIIRAIAEAQDLRHFPVNTLSKKIIVSSVDLLVFRGAIKFRFAFDYLFQAEPLQTDLLFEDRKLERVHMQHTNHIVHSDRNLDSHNVGGPDPIMKRIVGHGQFC